MCGQTVCYTLESCYNSLPQIPLFLYVFYPPIAECIQEKYWVWWERLWAVLSSTGNRFFSRAVCNHGAVLFPMIARPLAKCANTHTCTYTHTHIDVHMASLCENVTSKHQQNIQREDQSAETSHIQVQVILPFLCIILLFSMAQQLWPMHYGLAKSVVKATW